MNDRYICRGKRKDNGEWVEGYFCCGNERQTLHDSIFVYDCETQSFDNYDIIPETIGQCTGLKDKNGKLIFEGDVVKLTDNNTEWKAYVVFGNPYGEYNWGWNLMYIGEKPKVNTDILLWVEMEETGAYCEVIGNIHDDDLLEVER